MEGEKEETFYTYYILYALTILCACKEIERGDIGGVMY